MNTNIKLINSGFSLIDKKWGGIYRSGSYLIIGPRKSGRTLLGLQFAQQAAVSKETCVYFTTMRPKDLMIQAASIGFDLQTEMNKNSVIVVRVAPPNEAYESNNPDKHLEGYIKDIISVVKEYNPARIIFDELTYYIGFSNIQYLRDIFLYTLESIEQRNITSFFILGEPATAKAQNIISAISEFVTGKIYLKKSSTRIEDNYQGGTVVISPNVGHPEGKFTDEYIIKPYKGLLTLDEEREIKKTQEVNDIMKKSFSEELKSVSEKAKIEYTHYDSDPFGISNLYDYPDFSLILNNQIALFKSTGQKFNLLSLKLDPVTQINGLLSLNQLHHAIRLSISKKDKICVLDNKVFVLLLNSDKATVKKTLNKFKSNLPIKDDNYINTISKYISYLSIEVNDNYENSETMLALAMDEKNTNEFYQLLQEYVLQ